MGELLYRGYTEIGITVKFYVLLWGNANFRVLKYQHVGIVNANFSRWRADPTQSPNASSFASSGI